MSGMDNVSDQNLKLYADHCGGDMQRMARELLAHRRASQALAWALPAEGDTIDRMRAILWSSPEGRAMNNRGDAKLYWLNEGDVYVAMLLSTAPAQEGEPRHD